MLAKISQLVEKLDKQNGENEICTEDSDADSIVTEPEKIAQEPIKSDNEKHPEPQSILAQRYESSESINEIEIPQNDLEIIDEQVEPWIFDYSNRAESPETGLLVIKKNLMEKSISEDN